MCIMSEVQNTAGIVEVAPAEKELSLTAGDLMPLTTCCGGHCSNGALCISGHC